MNTIPRSVLLLPMLAFVECSPRIAIDPRVIYHPEPELVSYKLVVNPLDLSSANDEFEASLTNTGMSSLEGCLGHPWEIRPVDPAREGFISVRSHPQGRTFNLKPGQVYSWTDRGTFSTWKKIGKFIICFSVRDPKCRGPVRNTACSEPIDGELSDSLEPQ